MPDLSELMYVAVATQKLAEYARLHALGDVLTYLLEVAARQADWQYSLALRLSEVRLTLADAAGPEQELIAPTALDVRADC